MMTTRTRNRAALGWAAFAAALAVLCTLAASAPALASASAGVVSPLPPSAYAVHAACPSPTPGHAGCLAMQLVPLTAEARAHTRPLGMARRAIPLTPSPAAGSFGLRPQDLHSVYQLPETSTSTETIALVDAYNDPNADVDLEAYDQEFKLPPCTTENGCFEQVNQEGRPSDLPFPQTAKALKEAEAICARSETGESQRQLEEQETACYLSEEARGWSVEISLDIETAHAVCQNCHIALVEADESSFEDLATAEEAAVALGATEISNSWGGPESECVEDGCATENRAFDHPGIVITAAAGDDGYLSWDAPNSEERGYANFPASSPDVVAVGGTRLAPLGPSGDWTDETVWNGDGAGGGGCSVVFMAQPWQQSDSEAAGCGGRRAVADVAADADPYTGVAIRDSSPECESRHLPDWCTIGGTSLASPLIAATFALAGGAQGTPYPARTLYENSGSLHDILGGSNGECANAFNGTTGLSGCTTEEETANSCPSHPLICQAGTGYDGPTGVGTPDGITAFQPTSGGGGEGPASTRESGNGGGKSQAGEGSGSSGSSGGSGSGSGSPGSSPAPTVATPTLVTVRLSGLALTVNALIALNTTRPRLSQLGFTFTINLAARVRASLAKLLDRRGRARWQPLARPLTIAATGGRDARHFGGHGLLSAGTYRLTLTPVGGTASSIVFKIG